MANYYGVSLNALTMRLEELRLLPAGIWEKLKDRGLKVRKVQEQLGISTIPARDSRLPIRYQYLAIAAFNECAITEGQLAKFLGVDRLEARRIVEELHTLELPNCDFGQDDQ
jgi:Zn-dependent peptidase ImmA (M78 family)